MHIVMERNQKLIFFINTWPPSSAANSKLNNFIRLEPTLLLLGLPFDLNIAKALIQERHGAATSLLYQLYIVLQKKKRLGLTGTAMETLQPVATARLNRVENNIYTEVMRVIEEP